MARPQLLVRADQPSTINSPGHSVTSSSCIPSMLRCRDQVRYGASIARRLQLFVYDLDPFVDHLPGKPVNRDMHPVPLFAFDDKPILKTCSVRRVAAALPDHTN